MLKGLAGGVDECPEAAFASGMVGADAALVGQEIGAGLGQLDAPPGTATVAAVDGGERVEFLGHFVVAGAESAVVGPSESGQGRGEPVDAGELSDPQVGLDGDEASAVFGPQMTEGGDQLGQEVQTLAHCARRAVLAGENGGFELVQMHGAVGEFDHGLHHRVTLRQRNQRSRGGRQSCGLSPQTSEDRRADRSRIGNASQGVHSLGDFSSRRGGDDDRVEVGEIAGRSLEPGLGREPGFGDHAVRVEGLTEDRFGESEHRGRVALVAQGGGGRDRGDPPERTLPFFGGVGVTGGPAWRPMALQRQAEAAQQHRHVGALGAVVGVELVEHEVLQAVGTGRHSSWSSRRSSSWSSIL